MAIDKSGEEWKEYNDAVRWATITVLISLAALIILSLVSMPLGYLIGNGISAKSLAESQKFLVVISKDPSYLFSRYWNWFIQLTRYDGAFSLAMWIPSLPLIVFPIILGIGLSTNPYKFQSNVHGAGRIATEADIEKMGLFAPRGFCCVLGKFKGRYLKMPETLSALCCAPPGTGKTAGIVIPTILNSPGMSMIINDPKPELCFDTSGFRAKEGPVFIINWGQEDNPKEGIYYPAWNPISPCALPAPGPGRDLYIDSMCNTLVEEPKGGADPHWANAGRGALTGFIHFIAFKCERARANDYFIGKVYENNLDEEDKRVLEGYYADMDDPQALIALQNLRQGTLNIDNFVPIGTWSLLPERWVGRESCLAMILEWITEAQIKMSQDIKRRIEEGDQMAAMADPMRDLLDEAIDEARKFGYSQRCIVELSQLSSMPDKERGSVLSTGFAGIRIFKNSAVVARTSFSDLQFKDMRGMKDPVTGQWKPISVYLSINQVDAKALNVINALFVDLMSSYLIANKPNVVNPTDGKMGPYPVIFVLDEFPTMPKLQAVIVGPAVGRGQKISYLLIGQDLGQISGKYGKDDLETVISTTAVKIILSQNNETTAQRFSKMIGNKTVQTSSFSKTEGGFGGAAKGTNPFSKNVSYQLQGVPVISASQLLSLDMLKQVVLMQGAIEKPVMADAPRYYLDKGMLAATKMKPAPNVPDWIVAQREDINEDMLSKLGIEYEDDGTSEFSQEELMG
ncbi:MAG: type IV secretory system conjugative DNA transfer family protein [Alphaproteobacteria bacterium]